MPDQALETAYARGDHRSARRIARTLVRESNDASEVARAARILQETTPDFFLSLMGALGLGLVVWLVYNYVL